MSINLPDKYNEPQIFYECNSPLVEGQPYFYCKTNGKDYLEQYEFGEDYRQFSKEEDANLHWKKIIIKKIDGEDNNGRDIGGRDIIFEGVLGDSYDQSDFPTQEHFERVKSKEFLDKIIQKSANVEKEANWDRLVNSFKYKQSISPIWVQLEANEDEVVFEEKHPDWQKFCSEKFRFEVYYPEDWGPHFFSDGESEGSQLKLNYYPPYQRDMTKGPASFKIFTNYENISVDESKVDGKRYFEIDGESAILYMLNYSYKKTWTEFDGTVIFEKDGIFYSFEIRDITPKYFEKLEDIISSFRFLPDSEECDEIHRAGIFVRDGIIFEDGEEIGAFSEGKISFCSAENEYSFSGDPESFHKDRMANTYYKRIRISPPHEYWEDSGPKITYECDSSLVPSQPYFYCETNGKDYLEQYEFGRSYRRVAPETTTESYWRKILVKKINGVDVLFQIILQNTNVSDDVYGHYKSLLKYDLIEDLNYPNEQSLNMDYRKKKELAERIEKSPPQKSIWMQLSKIPRILKSKPRWINSSSLLIKIGQRSKIHSCEKNFSINTGSNPRDCRTGIIPPTDIISSRFARKIGRIFSARSANTKCFYRRSGKSSNNFGGKSRRILRMQNWTNLS